MAKFNITWHEIKGRFGYILLGFFTVFLVNPIQTWIESMNHINLITIGIIGIIATLYFFDFD